MDERDPPAAGAASRHLVDETIPRRPAALERLVQIRHAVADMMDARPTLGEELRHRAVRVAGLEERDLNVAQRQADDQVELLEPRDPHGPVAKFLAKRGPGIHHVCYRVPELDQALERCRAAGYRLIDE